MLRVVNTRPVTIDVREMPCDQCAEAIRLIFYRRPDDFHPP